MKRFNLRAPRKNSWVKTRILTVSNGLISSKLRERSSKLNRLRNRLKKCPMLSLIKITNTLLLALWHTKFERQRILSFTVRPQWMFIRVRMVNNKFQDPRLGNTTSRLASTKPAVPRTTKPVIQTASQTTLISSTCKIIGDKLLKRH